MLALLATAACGHDPDAAKRKFLASGEAYFAKEDYGAAIVQFRNAVQEDPKFGEARFRLARAYTLTGETANAFRESVRAADLLQDRADAQLQAANFLILAGRFSDAKARADRVIQKEPNNVQAQIVLGNALAGLKDMGGAIKQLEEAIRLAPERGATYSNLGALHAVRGDLVAAEKAFQTAVAREPLAAAPRLALAQFYWLGGRTAEAESSLVQAHRMAPDDAGIDKALAVFYETTGRPLLSEPFLKAIAKSTGTPQATLALADYFFANNRASEAAPLFAGLAADPKLGIQAQLRLAAIELQEGRAASAHKTVDAILAKEPKNVDALVAKASLLLQMNRLDEALTRVNAAAAIDTKSARAQYIRGRILVAKQQPEEAQKAFNEALRLNPRAAVVQVELARLELGSSPDSSAALAGAALKNDPRSADARLVLARASIARGQLNQAEKLLNELLAALPESPVVHAATGLLYARRNSTQAAAREFEKALELDSLHLEALAGMTALDLSRRDTKAAVARVDAAVQRAPQRADLLTLAAKTHLVTGDPSSAESLLLRALATDPAALGAYPLLGQLYLSQKRLDEARAQFERLAQRQSRPVAALTMVGMILQMQDRQDEARQAYERVLAVDSRAGVAANNLAWMYAGSGKDLELALQFAQTAKAALPDQPEVDDTLGWIYYRKNLTTLAIGSLERSVQQAPNNAVFHFHLGMAYAQHGDKAAARQTLTRALELQPNFEGAAEANRVLQSL
jgi:tetratricopeptide (TPR) repeat protein